LLSPEHLGRAAQQVGEFITVILGSASAGLMKTEPIADEFAQLSKFSNEVDGNDGFSSARLAFVFDHVFGGAHEAIAVFASGQMDKTSAISGYQLEHHAAQHDSTDGNFARLYELAVYELAVYDVSGFLIRISVFEVRHRASSSSRWPFDCMMTPLITFDCVRLGSSSGALPPHAQPAQRDARPAQRDARVRQGRLRGPPPPRPRADCPSC